MLVENDKILKTYYDHYKETSTLSKEAQFRRNKNFAIKNLVCGILEFI